MGNAPEVYLDYNATAPVRQEALDAFNNAIRDGYGNPASTHAVGRRARRIQDDAREKIAELIGANGPEVYFVAGGTEGNNIAILGTAAMHGRGHVITSRIEHPAVLEACRNLDPCAFDVTYLDADASGRVDPEAVRDAIRDDTILISVMWVNNETGVIQPVETIGAIARQNRVKFHTDAVQAFGRIPLDVRRIPVDLLTISAHKFCAPKGVGALYVRRGVKVASTVHGGGQERGLRSGTENVPGVAAMAEAAVLASAEREAESARLASLRDRLEDEIARGISDTHVNGAGAPRVANTLNLRFEGADGEAVLIGLDENGVAVSSASACAASSNEPSHVLMAMGLSKRDADESLRLSLGRLSVPSDVDRCLDVLPGVVERVRSYRGR
jgi:cysteine desulfurase